PPQSVSARPNSCFQSPFRLVPPPRRKIPDSRTSLKGRARKPPARENPVGNCADRRCCQTPRNRFFRTPRHRPVSLAERLAIHVWRQTLAIVLPCAYLLLKSWREERTERPQDNSTRLRLR